MGGTSQPVLSASRIANASRVAQASDDTSVTNWSKADELVLATQLDEQKGPWTAAYKLRWRDVTDAGSFADLASTGECKFGPGASLTDNNAVTIGEVICTNNPGGTFVNGYEKVGTSTTPSLALADEDYTELQFSISLEDSQSGHQYEFEVYDSTNSASIGTCLAAVTIAQDVVNVVQTVITNVSG